MVAINASAFYAGVRFRRGLITYNPNECLESECAVISRDMWRLGFQTILADPTVQVAYEYDTGYHLVHNMSEEALFDNRTHYIEDSSLTGEVHRRKCCPLLNSPGGWRVNETYCRMK